VSSSRSGLLVDVYLGPDDVAAALRADAAAGLTSTPKWLPPKWFYDDRGSELFDQITRLPEYYPTECERDILRREANTIAERSGADTLIELGSGTSDKTPTLLDAFSATGQLARFVPFDVCEGILREAGAEIAAAYPGVEVHGVVGDFEHHLGKLPDGGRRLVALLGGTIGNLVPNERAQLLDTLVATMAPGDGLLLGTDLVKEPERLVAAYDDQAGVTAEFNRNLLRVLNRELAADFVPERFQHVALFDTQHEWIEMRLRSTIAQRAHVGALDLDVDFARGEELRTEISSKFRPEGVERELAAAGLELAEWWTDANGDYGLSLSFCPTA